MNKNDVVTIQDGKQYLRERMYDKGADCPCCTQFVKVYDRSLTSSMVWGLAEMFKKRQYKWTHAEDFFKSNDDVPSSVRGDFAKMRIWGLIQKSKDQVGHYRVTPKGARFLLGEIRVPKKWLIYNNRPLRPVEEKFSIYEASKNKFDINDVLGPVEERPSVPVVEKSNNQGEIFNEGI